MVATNVPLALDQGADFSQVVTWTDSSSNPINLTGYYVQLRIKPPLPDVPLSYDTTGGAIVLTPLSGIITINIPHATTATYNWSQASYVLEATSSGSVLTRLLEGTIVNNIKVA